VKMICPVGYAVCAKICHGIQKSADAADVLIVFERQARPGPAPGPILVHVKRANIQRVWRRVRRLALEGHPFVDARQGPLKANDSLWHSRHFPSVGEGSPLPFIAFFMPRCNDAPVNAPIRASAAIH